MIYIHPKPGRFPRRCVIRRITYTNRRAYGQDLRAVGSWIIFEQIKRQSHRPYYRVAYAFHYWHAAIIAIGGEP